LRICLLGGMTLDTPSIEKIICLSDMLTFVLRAPKIDGLRLSATFIFLVSQRLTQ
jgi:hypothetical protein